MNKFLLAFLHNENETIDLPVPWPQESIKSLEHFHFLLYDDRSGTCDSNDFLRRSAKVGASGLRVTREIIARYALTSEVMMPIIVPHGSRPLSRKTPDWSARFTIVRKTVRFARRHCPFYRSALQVPSSVSSSLDPCPGIRLSAFPRADVAKHNYSTGPAGVKSAAVLAQARVSQSRTNGARSLRKKSEKMDRRTPDFVSFAPRHARIAIRMPAIDDIERPSRATAITRLDFCAGARKNHRPAVHFS